MLEETVATYLAVASVVRTPEVVAIPTACDAFPGAAIPKVFANQEPPHQLRDTRARWPPLPDGDHQWHRCCDGGGGEGRLCDHCRSGCVPARRFRPGAAVLPTSARQAAGGRTQTMVGHDVRHPAGQPIGAEGR